MVGWTQAFYDHIIDVITSGIGSLRAPEVISDTSDPEPKNIALVLKLFWIEIDSNGVGIRIVDFDCDAAELCRWTPIKWDCLCNRLELHRDNDSCSAQEFTLAGICNLTTSIVRDSRQFKA